MVLRIEEAGRKVADAASAAGLSERRAYQWLARYRAGGDIALHDRSSSPRGTATRCRTPAMPRSSTCAAADARRPDRPPTWPAALDRGRGAAPTRVGTAEGARSDTLIHVESQPDGHSLEPVSVTLPGPECCRQTRPRARNPG